MYEIINHYNLVLTKAAAEMRSIHNEDGYVILKPIITGLGSMDMSADKKAIFKVADTANKIGLN